MGRNKGVVINDDTPPHVYELLATMACWKADRCKGWPTCGSHHDDPSKNGPYSITAQQKRKQQSQAEQPNQKSANGNPTHANQTKGNVRQQRQQEENPALLRMSPQKKVQRALALADRERSPNPITNPEPDKYYISGFTNVGSSCYINAVIQGLVSLRPFTEELMKIKPSQEEKLIGEIQRTITRVKEGEKRIITPHKLVQQISDSMQNTFGNRKQQDVHEFAIKLLEKLQEEEMNILYGDEELSGKEREEREKNTVVNKIFYGIKEKVLTCINCKREASSEEGFNCLLLNIPPRHGKINMEECMKYTDAEEIVKRLCEYCTCEKAKKREVVKTNPKCLIVMLKRFGDQVKNTKLVQFPIQTRGMNLKAVVDHQGESMTSGHYVAKCWNQMTQKWYLMDDQLVKEVKEDRLYTQDAYMMMYLRDDEEDDLKLRTEEEGNETKKEEKRNRNRGFVVLWFSQFPNYKYYRKLQNRSPFVLGNVSLF
jgi:ubiquitin C-terminal hydrolase